MGELLPQEPIPGNFLTKPSHSQESEDINSSKKTWTCSSTSKITLTPTLLTLSTLLTSLRLERPLLPTWPTNTTTVNSLTQPTSTQEKNQKKDQITDGHEQNLRNEIRTQLLRGKVH